MSDLKRVESDSLLKSDDDPIDIDPNMNVSDILNEEDDLELPTKKKTKTPSKNFQKTQSLNVLKKENNNFRVHEEPQIKINNQSDFLLKNFNTEESKTPFGDSKNELILSKISFKNENNKSSNLEEMEILKQIEDSSVAKTPTNINYVSDFLKESEDIKDNESEFSRKNSIRINVFEKLEKEELDFSKISEILISNNDFPASKYVLSDDLNNIFVSQIENIRFESLEKVSNTLFSQYSTEETVFPLNSSFSNANVNFGLPRCISANEKFIVIGTSNSLICVFDYNTQKLLKLLGGTKEQAYGCVSSIDISKESDYLISGYEYGEVILWDIVGGVILKNVFGVHETPIINVKFYKKKKAHAITCDAKGNVYLLQINKVLFSYTVDKKLLFDKYLGPVLSLHIFENQEKEQTSLLPKDYILVGCTTFHTILIISVEPTVNLIYKINRPEYIKEGVIPQISYGIGTNPDSSKVAMFLIAYGNLIELFPLRFKENLEINSNLESNFHYISDYEIIYCSWIAQNQIFYIDSQKRAFVLDFHNFESSKFSGKITKSTKAAILNQHQISSEIYFQNFIKYKNERLRPFFRNTIQCYYESKQVLLIGFKQIIIGRLYKWKELIEKLIQNNEWIQVLKLSLELHSGKLRLFSDFYYEDQNNFISYMKEIIKLYVEKNVNHEKENHETENDKVIKTSLDFLITFQLFEFLFTEMKDIFKKHDLSNMFLANLENFILKNRIKFVPNKYFHEIANYYKSKKKTKVLEILIINLNIETLDQEFIISLCLEFYLCKALIYICNRLDNDFITPLVKIFMMYKEKLEKNENDAKHYGYNCLWYIKICLQGISFPKDEIPPDVYKTVVKNLVVWVFIEENIKILIELDIFTFFPVIFLFFSSKSSSILKQSNDSLAHYFEDHHLVKNNINYNKDPLFTHKSIIDIIMNCIPKGNQKVTPYLYYYVAKSIVICEITLEFDFFFEISLYILRNCKVLQEIQSKPDANSSCYLNYYNDDLEELTLKLFKLYEIELRDCASLDALKEAIFSTSW